MASRTEDLEQPMIPNRFSVDTDRVLSALDLEIAGDRQTAYCLSKEWLNSPDAIASEARNLPPLRVFLADFLSDEVETAGEPEEAAIDVVEGKIGSDAEAIVQAVAAWLDGDPVDDEEYTPLVPTDAVEAAFRYFQDKYEKTEVLRIEVTEGDRPGSNYCDAVLTISVDEANEIAEQNGWEERFELAEQ